ncbi:MAG TPA: ABC transporter substrate-binding protein [Chloroflexia bacterium]|nr:ABC transporter substrate-binding protein [Chloroflexia bacterium]
MKLLISKGDRYWRLLSGLIALMLVATVLAACGDNTATPAAASTTAAAASTTAAAGASATTAASNATTAAAGSAGGDVKMGGSLRIALENDVSKLDPMLSSAFVERQVFYNMYDSLVAIDDKLNIVPSLADSWTQPDPKTYIFKLHPNVKFHDGTDFNADAVKFNIERDLTGTGSQRKSEISSIASVEVVDPLTVKFNLTAPFAPLLANLVDRAGMMVSPTAVKKLGEEFVRNPVGAGTGPFKFVEWKKDDRIVLEKNPNYWRKDAAGRQLPYLDKVTYNIITDETARLTNLKTGDADIANSVPSKDVPDLRNSTEVVYKDTPSVAWYGFYLNVTADPFTNKALRQAVAYAVDRESILKTVFFNIGAVSTGPIPPPSWAYDPSYKPYTRDVAKAKAKLAEGNKPDGFSFKLEVAAGSPQNLQEAQLIRDQLKEAGITVEIVQLEFSKILDDLDKKQYNAALVGWSGRIDPDGNIYNQFHTGSPLNNSGYSNKDVDKLLEAARTSSDQNERKTDYQNAQKQIMDDASYIFINYGVAVEATTKKVQNFLLLPDNIIRLSQVWLK